MSEETKDILTEIVNDEESVFEKKITLDSRLTIAQQKRFEEQHWFFKYRIKALQKLLKGYLLTDNAEILDVGVGTGTISTYLENFGNVTHVEIDSDSIKLNPDMKIIQGLFPWQVNLANKKFDAIILFNVLEYNTNIRWYLDIVRSLLKPNGKIFISSLAGKSLTKNDILYGVKQRFVLDDFSKMFEEINMNIVYNTYFENHSLDKQIKETMDKWFDETTVDWNVIPDNNDEIYNNLLNKEFPKLGINRIFNGNQLFVIVENMTKEEILNRSIKNAKNNKKVSIIDLAIDKIAKKTNKDSK